VNDILKPNIKYQKIRSHGFSLFSDKAIFHDAIANRAATRGQPWSETRTLSQKRNQKLTLGSALS